MPKYLVIPRIVFRGANAQPASWCVGAPGPSAMAGFAQAAARAMQLKNVRPPVGIVLHDWRLRAEVFDGVIAPHQLRGAALINGDDYAQGTKSLSGQPTVRGDGEMTLVLQIDDKEDAIDEEALLRFMDRARIAGGTIVSHKLQQAKIPLYSSWAEVQAKVKSGYALVDRADLLAPAGPDDKRDPLDRFLAATAPSPVGKGDDDVVSPTDTARLGTGWLTPYVAAWLSLNKPSGRDRSRDGLPSVFADSLIGLGQWVSVRQLTHIPFWSIVRHDQRIVRFAANSVLGDAQAAA